MLMHALFSSSIQTLTVGFGIPPNQSFLQESRTITAGRELRPALKKIQYKIIISSESAASFQFLARMNLTHM